MSHPCYHGPSFSRDCIETGVQKYHLFSQSLLQLPADLGCKLYHTANINFKFPPSRMCLLCVSESNFTIEGNINPHLIWHSEEFLKTLVFSLISSCCTSCSSSSLLHPPILKTLLITSLPAQTVNMGLNFEKGTIQSNTEYSAVYSKLGIKTVCGGRWDLWERIKYEPKTHTRNCIWFTWSYGTFQCHHGEVGWNYCSYSPMTAKNIGFPGPWCLGAWYKPVFLIFRDYCDLNVVSSPAHALSCCILTKHDERGWLFLTGSVKICGR